jgi:hypothetical protein
LKIGIEELYQRCEKLFGVVEGYLDDKQLGSIFRMCRLKPHKILSAKTITPKTELHNHWIDEYHNSLVISKAKRIKLVMNDLTIGEGTKTDLYGGLSITKTILISKLAYLTKDDEWIIALLGIDGYLRTFIDLDGWQQCSPLLLGMDRLRTIDDYRDTVYSSKIENSWVVKLPVSKEDD